MLKVRGLMIIQLESECINCNDFLRVDRGYLRILQILFNFNGIFSFASARNPYYLRMKYIGTWVLEYSTGFR